MPTASTPKARAKPSPSPATSATRSAVAPRRSPACSRIVASKWKSSAGVARLHLLESGRSVDYRYISAEDLAAQEAAGYDVVTCMEMLEHVPNPASTIVSCAALVKPGGHVFFSTINRNPKAYVFAVLGAEYILQLLPKGTHEYAKFIKPSELSRWAKSVDLELNELIGMSYNLFTKHYSLGTDTSVNYLVHTIRNV
jgi:2-polyprenyl-6-hydroxyphenyl methylase/3-demethylubiquinone-9 3-methyltransferase